MEGFWPEVYARGRLMKYSMSEYNISFSLNNVERLRDISYQTETNCSDTHKQTQRIMCRVAELLEIEVTQFSR